MLFNQKIDGFLLKSWNYSPYNYSELFKKTANYSKKHLKIKNNTSKRLFNLMVATESKSALDYDYWNNKTLFRISIQVYNTKQDIYKLIQALKDYI